MSRAPTRFDPLSLGGHAEDTLRFIRASMERSATFTAVPGFGGAAMGLVGLAASVVASSQPTADRWLAVWLSAAVVATAIGLASMARKASRAGLSLTGQTARRFVLGVAAPCAAGAGVTYALWAMRTYSAGMILSNLPLMKTILRGDWSAVR